MINWYNIIHPIRHKKMKNFLKDFKLDDGLGWDDYDKNGIPYWDYFWHNDEETGDGWRLVLKEPEITLTKEDMTKYYGAYSEEDLNRID